jgi:amidase
VENRNPQGTTDQLLDRSAAELAGLVRSRHISSEELVRASLLRIEELDPDLNAFVHVDETSALRAAVEADKDRHNSKGSILCGVPIAVKDLTDVHGMPTTQGSRLFAEAVARSDEESVRRMRRAGAIVMGKTNTPEFGFGAVCTNRVFGPTRNPWDRELTSGGSSGGSAVAVASGMVPLAQGTDYGGSVRTPAAFCGCVGLRPTPGSIPEPRRFFGWDSLVTQGVLARDVADAELMFRAMRGPDPLDPVSVRGRTGTRLPDGLRVARSATLGGAFRLDHEVNTAFEEAVAGASEVFGVLAPAEPDVHGASDAFQVLRAAQSWTKFKDLISEHRADLTESFVWNVEQGSHLSAEEYLHAEQVRTRTYRNFVEFFGKFDILIMPAASVLPFPIKQGEVTQIAGEPTETIIDYLACTYIISLVGFPSLVLPAPNMPLGLPFGVQLVAAPDHEGVLLSAGRALQEAGFRHRRPQSTTAVSDAPALHGHNLNA